MNFLHMIAIGFLGFFLIVVVAAVINAAIHLFKEIINDTPESD
jgi:hypothetical protein